MSINHAIILNNPMLEYEIVFRKIKTYIDTAVKNSDVEKIFYANDLQNLPSEILDCDNLLVIKDLYPCIPDYLDLLETHTETSADVTYVADGEDNTEVYLVKTSKLDTLLSNSQSDLKVERAFLDQSWLIPANDLGTMDMLNSFVKTTINLEHQNYGVYFLDIQNTYISPDVLIEKGTTILPNTIIKGVSSIGENCVIGPNTVIDTCAISDNVKINSSQAYESIIGKGTTVGPFAYIRPQSIIGENVKIGDFVEIKKATLGDGTKVSHLTYIGDAEIGKNVNFGCGTVVVNYDSINKHKTIVEDDAFIGCNTNLVSPVKVCKGAFTAAGSTITKEVPENALGIARVKQENKPEWAKKFRSINKKVK